jgi:hypothetical protein
MPSPHWAKLASFESLELTKDKEADLLRWSAFPLPRRPIDSFHLSFRSFDLVLESSSNGQLIAFANMDLEEFQPFVKDCIPLFMASILRLQPR